MFAMRRMAPGLAALLLVVAAGPVRADEHAALLETLRARFPEANITSVGPSPVEGWHEVVTPQEIVYANADGSLLLAGRLIDTATKEDLTARSWNAVNARAFDKLPFEQALKVVRGDGSRRLVVFSDPHCPFCKRLEGELAGLRDVTIYTFIYPLEDLHPGATATARGIWCAADRVAAWDGWMRDKTAPPGAACEADPVESVVALGTRLGIDATPTLLLEDGRRLAGALPQAQIELELGVAAQAQAALQARAR